MPSIINASTTLGLISSADTSGVLQLQTANTTAVTINASQNVTFTGSQTLSGGTANGVTYLNGSKVLTSGSALTFDGTNLGLGNAPASWNTITALQVKNGSFGGYSSTAYMGTNWYYASGDKYITSTGAALYAADGNLSSHTWYTAAGGTAGNAITWTQSLQLAKGATLALEGATSQTGVGITFPATQNASSNANTLDDYEEGTWTPSFNGGLSGVTYGTIRNGYYIKVGNQVTVWFGIMTNSLTVTGSSLNISGLPFQSKNEFGANAACNITNASRWVSSPPVVGEIPIGTSVIYLYSAVAPTGAGTDPTQVTTGNMSTGGANNRNVVYGTATYTV